MLGSRCRIVVAALGRSYTLSPRIEASLGELGDHYEVVQRSPPLFNANKVAWFCIWSNQFISASESMHADLINCFCKKKLKTVVF